MTGRRDASPTLSGGWTDDPLWLLHRSKQGQLTCGARHACSVTDASTNSIRQIPRERRHGSGSWNGKWHVSSGGADAVLLDTPSTLTPAQRAYVGIDEPWLREQEACRRPGLGPNDVEDQRIKSCHQWTQGGLLAPSASGEELQASNRNRKAVRLAHVRGGPKPRDALPKYLGPRHLGK